MYTYEQIMHESYSSLCKIVTRISYANYVYYICFTCFVFMQKMTFIVMMKTLCPRKRGECNEFNSSLLGEQLS